MQTSCPTSPPADAATSRLTGRSLSQAFGLATVWVYHRRSVELDHSAEPKRLV